MNYIDNNRLRQYAFLGLLIVLGIVIFAELKVFIPATLGAITFYVLMRNFMDKLVYKHGWKRGWAALLMIILSILIVLVPIWVLVTMLTKKMGNVLQNIQGILDTLKGYISGLEQKFDVHILSENTFTKASENVTGMAGGILSGTFSTLTSLAIMYFVLYFMLVRKRELEEYLHEYIPLKDDNINWIGREMNALVYNNAIGVPLIAILQGVVGLIGYLIFGAPDPWFWFVITTITSMLPIIGAAAGYVPLALVMFAGDTEPWRAWAILIWGFGIIGVVDNVFRFLLQKKLGDVHPLITIFGVIIGINMFGFIGLIFGPIVISMFLLLVKVYINEFATKRSTRAAVRKDSVVKKDND